MDSLFPCVHIENKSVIPNRSILEIFHEASKRAEISLATVSIFNGYNYRNADSPIILESIHPIFAPASEKLQNIRLQYTNYLQQQLLRSICAAVCNTTISALTIFIALIKSPLVCTHRVDTYIIYNIIIMFTGLKTSSQLNYFTHTSGVGWSIYRIMKTSYTPNWKLDRWHQDHRE